MINFQNIVNVRDLGGYHVSGGYTIKRGLLFRGADLSKASYDDIAILSRQMNIRLIFDFRSESEIQRSPDKAVPGAISLWIPTLDPNLFAQGKDPFRDGGYKSAQELIMKASNSKMVQKAARMMYTDIADNEYSQLQYAVFLQKVVAAKNGAVYWHCAQGKDRTGMGAAFLLAALGADRETILYDYNLSGPVYEKEVQNFKQYIINQGWGNEELDVVQSFIGVNEKNFIAALDLIDEKYGGMDNYLREILILSDNDRQILKNRYLERSQSSGF